MSAYPYPPARRADDADDYHGERIPDPYRWLEVTDDPETAAWIKAQNELTESFLSGISVRDAIRERLSQLWDYPKAGVPFERGGRWFQSRNSGLQDQPVLYVMEAPDADGHPLLDPNLLSEDGTVAVTTYQVSDDGSLLAYATSAGGSDWRTWHVRDVATGEDTDDLAEWSKFSTAAWRKDASGFYYSAMDPPAPGAEYTAENWMERVCFHRLGTPQSQDEVVFAIPEEPDWVPYAWVTDDGRFLVISIQRRLFPENQVRVLDLTRPGAALRELVPDFACQALVIANVGDTFYVVTDHEADKRRLVAVDLADPRRGAWREVIPETAETLLDAHFFGGHLVCHYLRDAQSLLRVHALDGRHIRDIPFPASSSLGGGSAEHAISGRPDSDLVHFEVTSFTDSGSLWAHDLASGETRQVRGSGARVDAAAFVTEQVFVTSADGTRVPMFLTRRRDVEPAGDVPVLLYGYGGFDVAITPSFSVPWIVWMERGGILAVAGLRGGGEYGRAWHEAGRLARKQNVFDDFCACATWLAGSGWSRPGRIAINGGSNGGLLVGACLTQWPGLFGAAVPEVGVLDMLRFHKFTIGWAWTSDFGDPDDPAEYTWPRSYSPLHNLRPGEHYPATMVMTGDHDDRVVPGHSFKFAAALQAAQGGDAPVLIRVDSSAGHGQGKPTAKLIAAATDLLSFTEAALGPG